MSSNCPYTGMFCGEWGPWDGKGEAPCGGCEDNTPEIITDLRSTISTLTQKCRELEGERDEHPHCSLLGAERMLRRESQAKVEKLVELLREVEWAIDDMPGGMPGSERCPCCMGKQMRGHFSYCKLAKALSEEVGE